MNPYQKQVTFFLKEADRHWKTAHSMLRTGHYDWALFVGHLALEKLFKAIIVKKTKASAPFIHNLQELARRAGFEPSSQQVKDLGEITTFNIEARYDTVRLGFYKRCTKSYANTWLKRIDQFKIWLEKELQKK